MIRRVIPSPHKQLQGNLSYIKSSFETQKSKNQILRLNESFDRNYGKIEAKTFRRTIKMIGGFPVVLTTLIFTIITGILIGLSQTVILKWSEIWITTHNNQEVLGTLALILAAIGFATQFLFNIIIYFSGVRLSSKLHSSMVFRALHSQIKEYLNKIPFGVFLNRFSNDLDKIDFKIPQVVAGVANCLCQLVFVAILGLQTLDSVLVFLPVVVYLILTCMVYQKFMRPNREVVRLSNISKAPIARLVLDSVLGSPEIRSMTKERFFSGKMINLVNSNSKNYLMIYGLELWLRSTLAVLDFVVVLLPTFSIIFYQIYADFYQTNTNPPPGAKKRILATALYVINVNNLIPEFSRLLLQFADLETSMVHLERCLSFEAIEPESGYHTFKKDSLYYQNPQKRLNKARQLLSVKKNTKLFPEGRIEFRNVWARYPGKNKAAIKNLNLEIQPGERVGILGLSGSGKSTFISLLLRTVKPYRGEIRFDELPINQVDLKKLRRQINLVGQSTQLVEGTISDNISSRRLTHYEEGKILKDLKELGFSEEKLKTNGLSYSLMPDGANLSSGERRVLGLVKSLHEKKQIVVFDCGTSYLDAEAERRFQIKAQDCFEGCTMVVIGEKLEAVVGCDRVLVFRGGKVGECGRVAELLSDQSSMLSEMYGKS